jgi:hypothetical protein
MTRFSPLALLLTGCLQPLLAPDNDQDGFLNDVDCNDNDATIYPEAAEVAGDDIDSNCDGCDADETPVDMYVDADQDGYGAAATSAHQICPSAATRYALTADDCADDNDAIHPGVSEVCDGQDNDCNGTTDDNATDASTWFADADGDEFGDPSSTTLACEQPDNSVADNTDCNDNNPLTYPGATDAIAFDGVVNDCNGVSEGPYAVSEVSDVSLAGIENDQELANEAQMLVNGGDIDGDGFDDLIVASNQNGNLVGEAYAVTSALAGTQDVDAAANQVWQGATNFDQFGYVVNGGFDLDHDGKDETIYSAYTSTNFGRACLTYGGTHLAGSYDGITDCDATFDGTASGGLFGTDASGGDFDGDGFDDLAVSTMDAVYVYAGSATRLSGSWAPDDATWIYTGSAGDSTGYRVDLSGDIDGDGKNDLVVSSPNYGTSLQGRVSVVKGAATPTSGTLAAKAWATIDGTEAGQGLGTAIAVVPDLDGDIGDELLLGSKYSNGTSTDEGEAYLYTSATLKATPSLTSTQGTFTFTGKRTAAAYFGHAVAAGDVDGDGVGDLVVCALHDDTAGTDAGAAYFYNGAQLNALPHGAIDMTVPAKGLVEFTGENPGDNFCASAAFYDADHDGHDDLTIGVPFASGAFSAAGAVDVITSKAP